MILSSGVFLKNTKIYIKYIPWYLLGWLFAYRIELLQVSISRVTLLRLSKCVKIVKIGILLELKY